MHKTTRQRVLETIQKHQVLSIREIGQILGLTKANIRHHITGLMDNCLVEIVGQKQISKGRPTLLYGQSEKFIGNNLDILSSILLEELLSQEEENKWNKKIKALATRFASRMGSEGTANRSKRLNEVIEKLNSAHYSASWEASAFGAQVIIHRCPYRQVINSFPQLCSLDKFLLEECLQMGVERDQRSSTIPMGKQPCVFQLYERHLGKDNSNEIVKL